MRPLYWFTTKHNWLGRGAQPWPWAGLLALLLMSNLPQGAAQAVVTIPILTESTALVLQTDASQRLNTVYFGAPLAQAADYAGAAAQYSFKDSNAGFYSNAYTPAGTWNLSEPALEVTHADGNPSLELHYVRHTVTQPDAHSTLTRIVLRDPVYPFEVTLCYRAWAQENVIEQWAELVHHEKKPVVLQKYASANLYFTRKDFYLTTFQGQYAREMQPAETRLLPGTRSVSSQLGTRAMLLQTPNFVLGLGQPAAENEGTVLLGQLAWSGNFKLDFEVDSYQNLRLLAGINPAASAYHLPAGEVFKTPSLIYAVSTHGTGAASRGLQSWARRYRLLDGEGERLTLLNNWEATYFDFDEQKIKGLFADAKTLGVDMFLLDDGWFGNKYPRNNDGAGLGDWQENRQKLPHGLGYLVQEAKQDGLKFGIWLEPEMVNPKSELYEQHRDWVIRQPQRPEVYFRNQLVLDLANPQVQDFVYGIVDGLFTKNPDLAFVKWDCNAVIYNAYSAYLHRKGLPQSHLYVDYVRGLYKVLQRLRAKYPQVPMMLCSGGGGRADYELLRYFTEFWPSDDTEPLERVFMQWNYSYFFPAIATDNHVTDWGKQPLKYRVDVASMGKLGFDIVASKLSASDKQFAQEAVRAYTGFKNVVWHGEQYRLASPYEGDVAAVQYVAPDRRRAIVFNYLTNTRQKITATPRPLPLTGLDPAKKYRIRELNLYPGTASTLPADQVYSGDFLLKVGFNPDVTLTRTSVVLEVTAVE
ncbi:MAG: alpha-galactosidase [Janthinobacterium lividum]